MESHSGPWWYYLPAILLMAFPFGLTLLQPFTKLKTLIAFSLNRFLVTWFVFVLLFFSFSATKLPHYILYGLTPLFILGAVYLDKEVNLKSVYYPLIVVILLLLALPHLVTLVLPHLDNPALTKTLNSPENYLPGNYHLILMIILFCAVWLLIDRRWPHQGRLLSAGIITTFIASELLLPMVSKIQQEPIRDAGLIAAKHQAPTVMWRINNPSFSVYCGRITPKRKPTAGELVFTKSRHLKKLPSHHILYERQGVVLAMIDKEDLQNVTQQSPPIEQSKSMDTSSTDSVQRHPDTSDAAQHSPVSVAKQPHANGIEPIPMGNTNHTR
jgi:hypothetical protein